MSPLSNSSRESKTVSSLSFKPNSDFILFTQVALIALAFPFVILTICALQMYRLLVTKSAPWLRPDLFAPLRSNGTAFLRKAVHCEPEWNLMVQFKLKGPANFDRIKTMFENRLVANDAYPELRQYLTSWAGYFFWKREPDFSIHDHVQYRRLAVDEDVNQFQVGYVKQPLPQSKSPWQVVVLDCAESDSHHILFKYHHVLTDGFTLMLALMKCADEPVALVQANSKPKPTRSQAKRIPSPGSILAHIAPFLLKLPSIVLQEISRFVAINTKRLPPSATSKFEGEGEDDHIALVDEHQVPMTQIKEIAHHHSVSFSAVVFSAVTGAVRPHFLRKYGPDGLPETISCPQPVPVPSRDAVRLCNTFSTITVTLPIGLDDPVARLHAVDRMFRDQTRPLEAAFTYYVLQALSLVPKPFASALWSRYWQAVPVQVSNLPGPLHQIKINDQEVLEMRLTSAAFRPASFYASILSYNGVLRWSCNGHKNHFTQKELEELGKGITQEFCSYSS